MKTRKLFTPLAIGLVIAIAIHNVFFVNTSSVTAQSITPPTCLSSQRYATTGGSENLIHRYEGVDTNYWLYYTYGRADAEQQYPMELIATTSKSNCAVVFWNAPNHDFSYTDYVPMDVAKQFSLAQLEHYLEAIGQEEFDAHYGSIDRESLDVATQWALQQLED